MYAQFVANLSMSKKYAVFRFSHKKIIPKRRSLLCKNHRETIGPDGWPNKIAPIAMVRNGQKRRHRIVVIQKNIGIASLSKIDHHSSLHVTQASQDTDDHDDPFCLYTKPRYTWGPIYGSGCPSVHTKSWSDLTNVTLADEDIKSIQTNDGNMVNRAKLAMQLVPPGGQ